jgi:hypothetical protein
VNFTFRLQPGHDTDAQNRRLRKQQELEAAQKEDARLAEIQRRTKHAADFADNFVTQAAAEQDRLRVVRTSRGRWGAHLAWIGLDWIGLDWIGLDIL